MRAAVLRRYVTIATIATIITVVVGAAWAVVAGVVQAPPGHFEARQGDIALGDGRFAAASQRFAAALAKDPGHRGALMGRAIALLEGGRHAAAEAAFGRLIGILEEAGDTGALAAAYANRGILYDRTGRYEKALADYALALGTDAETVSGPGLVHRVLYGIADPATVGKRAAYLGRQLALPADRRLMKVPARDAEQRMHRP